MNPAHTGAVAIREAFDAYQAAFREITCRAKTRFELRDWLGIHRDGNERLDLYSTAIDQLLDLLRKLLGGRMRDHALWAQIKTRTSDLFSGREDSDLGETFFSSVSRRVFVPSSHLVR